MTDTKKRDDILRRVRVLVDKANSTTFEGERDACLAKADELMAVYAIEAFELEFARPANERVRPIVKVVEMPRTGDADANSDLRQVFHMLARHCEVLFGAWEYEKGTYRLVGAKVVGYEADIEYLELLFTGVYLQLSATIAPRPQPELEFYANVALLKEAGLKWDAIYRHLVAMDPTLPELDLVRDDEGALPRSCPYNMAVKMSKGYAAWCRRTGQEQIKANPKSYRANFREAYVATLRSRVYELSAARKKTGVGHEVVLAGREGALQEMLYEVYPDRRPHPPECECDPCHVVKCNDETCTRERCKQARKPIRWGRTYYRAVDHAAQRAGRRAAANVDLTGGRRNVDGKVKGAIG